MLGPDQRAGKAMGALPILGQGVNDIPQAQRWQRGEKQSFLLAGAEFAANKRHGVFLCGALGNEFMGGAEEKGMEFDSICI